MSGVLSGVLFFIRKSLFSIIDLARGTGNTDKCFNTKIFRKKMVAVLFYFKISKCHGEKDEFLVEDIRKIYIPCMASDNDAQEKDTVFFKNTINLISFPVQ